MDQKDIHNWEDEGGAVAKEAEELTLKLARADMERLFTLSRFTHTPQDIRIMDAFRRLLLNGHHTSHHG